jgi:DNA-binding LytR/AlgR family response regulator
MIPLNCIAIDDEPFALAILADDLKNIEGIQLIRTFSNTSQVEEFLNLEKIDLMFIDIQMPTQLGTQFLKSLANPPMAIITTAHEKFALEGFELNVVDYLLKPIAFSRLEQACKKAIHLHQIHQKDDSLEETFFFVHSEYNKIKIFEKDILYVEGLKDYVKIHLYNQEKPIVTRMNLKAIESKLSSNKFCRIHQSFIVSLEKIKTVQKSKLTVGDIELPIGQKYAEVFNDAYIS